METKNKPGRKKIEIDTSIVKKNKNIKIVPSSKKTLKPVDPLVARIGKKNKLTPQMIGYVQDLQETKNKAEATRRNYNVTTHASAAALGQKLSHLPQIEKTIKEIMEAQGLNGDFLINRENEIAELAIGTNQLAVAEKANSTLLKEWKGNNEDNRSKNFYIQVNGNVDFSAIDKILEHTPVIEGEIVADSNS